MSLEEGTFYSILFGLQADLPCCLTLWEAVLNLTATPKTGSTF